MKYFLEEDSTLNINIDLNKIIILIKNFSYFGDLIWAKKKKKL